MELNLSNVAIEPRYVVCRQFDEADHKMEEMVGCVLMIAWHVDGYYPCWVKIGLRG